MRLPMTAAFAAVAVVAGLTTIPSAWAADAEANKQLVRTFIEEVMNKRQPAAVDRFLATDFIEHNPNLPQGRDGRKQFVAAVLAGFSDYHGEIVEILAEGDKVVVRTQWSGTQDGPFLGLPPTGRAIALPFVAAIEFRDEQDRVAAFFYARAIEIEGRGTGRRPSMRPSVIKCSRRLRACSPVSG